MSDDYSISDYGSMLGDDRRMGPYTRSLRAAVKPGCIVLDIGTGSGIFALLAVKFGASRVYALDSNPVIELAREFGTANPGTERITWIKGLSTEVELPEPVDVIVGDLHGLLPFYGENIESLIDARLRLLRPGGQLIPARDILLAVPAHAPDEYRRVSIPWLDNEFGVDLSAASKYVSNSWWRADPAPVPVSAFLAKPLAWGEVDYYRVDSPSLFGEIAWSADADGVMHGFYVWFDSEVGPGESLSNSPELAALIYGRAFFPLPRPVDVQAGDRIEVRFSVRKLKGDYCFQWDSHLMGIEGQTKAKFRQSTFGALPLCVEDLRRSQSDFSPSLNPEGEATLFSLESMSRGLPLSDVAAELSARFPLKFPSPRDALDHVTRLSRKFSK